MPDTKDHKITLTVAGKAYNFLVTPETEHYMRFAAERINKELELYNAKYPDQTLADKLVYVALRAYVAKLEFMHIQDSYGNVEKELRNYLDKIEDDR